MKNPRQIPFRIELDEKVLLQKQFLDDHINFQKFMRCCVSAYTNKDPMMMKLLDKAGLQPKFDPAKDTLSSRDRESVLDEIEADD